VNLATTYLGLPLKNPLMVASCPLSEELDHIRYMEDAGAAGVVLFSIFEEQLCRGGAEPEDALDGEDHEGMAAYFPPLDAYRAGPEAYLDHLQRAVDCVDIPILGSVNGVTRGGWIDYASRMEQAGAAAIELNMYEVPVDPARSGQEVESRYLEVLRAVKEAVTIPVSLKLNPFFSSLAHMAMQCEGAGADGLVLFNRFLQPDLDVETGEIVPTVELSQPCELRLPLMWMAMLRSRLSCSLAATTGVHNALDLVKFLMAGADAVMVSSAILANGIPVIEALLEDLVDWLDRHEYTSLDPIQGCAARHAAPDPTAFQRANYIKALQAFDATTCR
jgi:dihydroorotate dehydrogenase (fumarate)